MATELWIWQVRFTVPQSASSTDHRSIVGLGQVRLGMGGSLYPRRVNIRRKMDPHAPRPRYIRWYTHNGREILGGVRSHACRYRPSVGFIVWTSLELVVFRFNEKLHLIVTGYAPLYREPFPQKFSHHELRQAGREGFAPNGGQVCCSCRL